MKLFHAAAKSCVMTYQLCYNSRMNSPWRKLASLPVVGNLVTAENRFFSGEKKVADTLKATMTTNKQTKKTKNQKQRQTK